jgi:hypothetical protein
MAQRSSVHPTLHFGFAAMVREEDIVWHESADLESFWVYREEPLVEHVVEMAEEKDSIL